MAVSNFYTKRVAELKDEIRNADSIVLLSYDKSRYNTKKGKYEAAEVEYKGQINWDIVHEAFRCN